MESSNTLFRTAVQSDLKQILALLADDDLGKTREDSTDAISPAYLRAFKEIEDDPNNELIVATSGAEIVAVLQITYIPNLTLKGTKRAQIEGVRVSSKFRGQGLGKQLFDFTLRRAQERGCKLAQLTSNKSRTEAIRFYEKIGFVSSHEGMKLALP